MKGSKVRKLIEEAEAIIVNNSNLVYHYLDSGDGFTSIDANHYDGEGNEYNWLFEFWDDDDIEIKNGDIYLLEEDGKYYPITLLQKQFIVDKSV